MAITVETLKVAVEQTGATKTSSSLKNVAIASAGAAAAFAFLLKGLKAINDAWAVQEKALIKTRTALKATDQEVAGNTKRIEAFTSSLQAATNIGDELTIGLVGTAIAMGASADEAMKATEASVGLSEALGIGLDAALKGVINAQNGNYSQLVRYIPALKGVTDETEAWSIINESVSSGLLSLEEQTKTLTGQMTRLKNSWGDYLEQVGRYLALDQNSIFNKLASTLENITGRYYKMNEAQEAYNNLSEDQKELFDDLSISAKTYSNWVEDTGYWTRYLSAQTEILKKSMDDLWQPEKPRSYWREFADGIIAANTHMTEFERIEYNRAEAIKASYTEFADFNEEIEKQINLYYDQEREILILREIEKERAVQNRLDAVAAREAEADRLEAIRKEIDAERLLEAQRRASVDAAMSMYGQLKSITQQYYANEIAAAGDNEEKLQEIREKQFRANQAFSIADTIINTAAAIMKVLAQGGIFAIPLSVAMGALGAAQVAMIASTKPSFADGTSPSGYTVPPGYEGDNFPVYAKSGETVNIGNGSGGATEITIMLDSSVIARVTTDLIENRQIVIRQSDLVA